MGKPKPYKVWTADRCIKKSLVATSLDNLKEKGAVKLKIPVSDVTVVMEADGTAVEDEQYFSFLEDNTVFLLLNAGEKWRPVWNQGGEDEPDSALDSSRDLRFLAMKLRENVGFLVTMTPEQLEVVAEAPDKELSDLTRYDMRDVRRIRFQCQRYLDELQEANDALQLLCLLGKSQQSALDTASSGAQDSVDLCPSSNAPNRPHRHSRKSVAPAKPYDRKSQAPGECSKAKAAHDFPRPLTDTRV